MSKDKKPWSQPRHGNSVRVFEGRVFNADCYTTIYSPGTWYSAEEAEALEAVAEAARIRMFFLTPDGDDKLIDALKALDEGRKGRT